MRMRARVGMTLMELVIGLVITGLMAATGAAAFASLIDHRRIIREASTSTERAAALRDMIRSWIIPGTIQLQVGGGPRGLSPAGAAAPREGASVAAVSAAQAAGDEISFTTPALNPSLLGNVRIRLYVDGDVHTPEKGLTIEYQPNALLPLVRTMLDSTIDTLRVEYLDQRTGRWIAASQVVAGSTSPRAVRLTLLSGRPGAAPPLLSLPMIFSMTTPTSVAAGLTR